MKRFFILLFILITQTICQAAKMPDNINVYLNKPYIGMSYEQALDKEIPFLLIFANPKDIYTAIRLAPIGEMVYEDFNGKYNFCIINIKKKENKNLIKFYSPQRYPALYIIDTQNKTYTNIEKRYFRKNALRKILTKFLDGTLFE